MTAPDSPFVLCHPLRRPATRPFSGWLLSLSLATFALALPLSAAAAAQTSSTQVTSLEADALTEPLGIDTPHPELSWRIHDPRAGARQTAYQISVFSHRPVSSTAKPDLWDSGRVESATSTGVPYAGPELQASKRYFWRVTVFDQGGKAYTISDASWFEDRPAAAEQLARRMDRP